MNEIFLNNYYGFIQGGNHGNQYTLPKEKVFTLANSNNPKNQSELAESYGITKQTMNNYMRGKYDSKVRGFNGYRNCHKAL